MVGIKRGGGITKQVGEEIAIVARLRRSEPLVELPDLIFGAGQILRIRIAEAFPLGNRGKDVPRGGVHRIKSEGEGERLRRGAELRSLIHGHAPG